MGSHGYLGVAVATFVVFLTWQHRCTTAHVAGIQLDQLKAFVGNHTEVIAYFFAEWCHACTQFDPIFQTLASFPTHEHLAFAKVNGSENRSASAYYVNDMFPGLAYFRDGFFIESMHGEKTVGERQRRSLVCGAVFQWPEFQKPNVLRWIALMTGDPVEWTEDPEQATARAKQFRVAFIARISNTTTTESDHVKALLQRVAQKHRNWGKFIGVLSNGSMSDSVLSVKHPLERPRNTLVTDDAEALERWLERHRFPLFGELDGTNQHEYYATGRNPLMLLGDYAQFKAHGIVFRKLAQQLLDTYSVVWVASDGPIGARLRRSAKVQELPALIVFNATGSVRDQKKFVYPGSNFNAVETVKAFLNDIHNGKVRPITASEHPTRLDDLQVARVKRVTGAQFETIVLHPDKHFVLALVAPMDDRFAFKCTNCSKAIQMLDHLATTIASSTSNRDTPILFGSLDVTKNEIPLYGWGGTWTFDELPVLYFVQANTTYPIQYDGPLVAASIEQFVKDHSPKAFDQEHLVPVSGSHVTGRETEL